MSEGDGSRTGYTALGVGLWRWKPFLKLEDAPRSLWLALYTSAEAKAGLPGLWSGGIHSMAEVACRGVDWTHNALTALVDARLVSWDPEHRLVRYMALPDGFERAHTQWAVKGWWTRFCRLPACYTRDAHVPLLWWMIEQGKVNESIASMWRATFGTLTFIPAPVDNLSPCQDTEQLGLFPSARSPVAESSEAWMGPSMGAWMGSGSGSGSGGSQRGEPRLKLVSGIAANELPGASALSGDAASALLRTVVEEVAAATDASWLKPENLLTKGRT